MNTKLLIAGVIATEGVAAVDLEAGFRVRGGPGHKGLFTPLYDGVEAPPYWYIDYYLDRGPYGNRWNRWGGYGGGYGPQHNYYHTHGPIHTHDDDDDDENNDPAPEVSSSDPGDSKFDSNESIYYSTSNEDGDGLSTSEFDENDWPAGGINGINFDFHSNSDEDYDGYTDSPYLVSGPSLSTTERGEDSDPNTDSGRDDDDDDDEDLKNLAIKAKGGKKGNNVNVAAYKDYGFDAFQKFLKDTTKHPGDDDEDDEEPTPEPEENPEKKKVLNRLKHATFGVTRTPNTGVKAHHRNAYDRTPKNRFSYMKFGDNFPEPDCEDCGHDEPEPKEPEKGPHDHIFKQHADANNKKANGKGKKNKQ